MENVRAEIAKVVYFLFYLFAQFCAIYLCILHLNMCQNLLILNSTAT